MLNKKHRPDVQGEIEELQRVTQYLNRDEGVDITVHDLVNAFQKSKEVTLDNETWSQLENTESNEIEKGDFDAVMDIAKKYDKSNPKKLAEKLKSGDYKRPLIVKFGDRYHVVAGNTRLCTSAALGLNPKVFIATIEVSDDLQEKWSEKYKKSIDCSNPKGFSQKAHCQGRKKKGMSEEVLKGGVSDGKTLEDIAKKHDKKGYYHIDNMMLFLKKQLLKGIKVEMEHTNDKERATEIAMDHLWEMPNYYDKLKKIEAKESMGADAAGAFSPAFNMTPIKRKITKIHNLKENQDIDEAMAADASGPYDVPFGRGGKDPLKIDGPDSIKKSRAVKDKKFPKYGGPEGVYVKIKEKCKKFPYCNQGDINALELLEVENLKGTIEKVSKKTGIPYTQLQEIVLNEIKKIFIE